MRLSLRRAVSAVFLFSGLLALNSVYELVTKDGANTAPSVRESGPAAKARGQGEQYQNGDRSGIRYTDKWRFILQRGMQQPVNPVDISGRRVSTLDRRKRSLDYYPANDVRSKKRHLDLKTFRKLGESGGPAGLQVPQAQGRPQHRATELNDIFISVKTTKRFHKMRLDFILDTWFIMARDQTYFFTDAYDPVYKKRTRGHLINTNCSSVHSRSALCCKMSVEYDTFLASGKRWFCHVDDDTYVNIPGLLALIQQYNHTRDWYLGKPSLTHPLEIPDIEHRDQRTLFWFATGGAGFCISRSLALKMMPFTAGGRLWTVCDKIRLPDDCTVGFIIYYYLKKELTVIPNFHSHLEGLWAVKNRDLSQQITFSYAMKRNHSNVVRIPGFSVSEDPSRFRSIHCALYPYMKGCPSSTQ